MSYNPTFSRVVQDPSVFGYMVNFNPHSASGVEYVRRVPDLCCSLQIKNNSYNNGHNGISINVNIRENINNGSSGKCCYMHCSECINNRRRGLISCSQSHARQVNDCPYC
jgi:hypothetical protein